MKTENKERVFSIELNSKSHLKNITITDGATQNVLVEGTIGKLVKAVFEESVVLEVVGTNGTLRLDLSADEIKKTTEKRNKVKPQ